MLLSAIVLAGCLPLVKESSALPITHPRLDELFPVSSEETVVIPVWEKYPAFISEDTIRESSTLRLADPVFTTAGALPRVHEQVSGRTSTGIMTPVAGVGSGIFFYGFVVISESGNILLLDRSYDPRDLTRCGSTDDDTVEALIALLASSSRGALGDAELWEFFDGKEIEIEFDQADRDRLVSFLENTAIPKPSITGDGPRSVLRPTG